MADERVNHDLRNVDSTSAEAHNSARCLKSYLNQVHAGYVCARGGEGEHVPMMAGLMRLYGCRARRSSFTPTNYRKDFLKRTLWLLLCPSTWTWERMMMIINLSNNTPRARKSTSAHQDIFQAAERRPLLSTGHQVTANGFSPPGSLWGLSTWSVSSFAADVHVTAAQKGAGQTLPVTLLWSEWFQKKAELLPQKVSKPEQINFCILCSRTASRWPSKTPIWEWLRL